MSKTGVFIRIVPNTRKILIFCLKVVVLKYKYCSSMLIFLIICVFTLVWLMYFDDKKHF